MGVESRLRQVETRLPVYRPGGLIPMNELVARMERLTRGGEPRDDLDRKCQAALQQASKRLRKATHEDL